MVREYFTHFSFIRVCATDANSVVFVSLGIMPRRSESMSTKAEEYYRKADEAEAEAQRTRDYAAQQIYLEIARQLRRIAALAERHEY